MKRISLQYNELYSYMKAKAPVANAYNRAFYLS